MPGDIYCSLELLLLGTTGKVCPNQGKRCKKLLVRPAKNQTAQSSKNKTARSTSALPGEETQPSLTKHEVIPNL